MSRAHTALIVTIAVPVLAGATITTATLGPAGGIAYAALLTAAIHTPRLFRNNRQDHQ